MDEDKLSIIGVVIMIIGIILAVLSWFNVEPFPFSGIVGWLLLSLGGFIGGYYSNKVGKKTSLFKLIAVVVLADGKVTDEEKNALAVMAKKLGISEKRFMETIKEITSGNNSFAIPDDTEEKEKNIRTLVKIAKVDGRISKEEESFIKDIAKKFGLSESFVDKLI